MPVRITSASSLIVLRLVLSLGGMVSSELLTGLKFSSHLLAWQRIPAGVDRIFSTIFPLWPGVILFTNSCARRTSNSGKAIAIHAATGPSRNIRFWREPEVAGLPEVAEV
jgi:hypothetical protein